MCFQSCEKGEVRAAAKSQLTLLPNPGANALFVPWASGRLHLSEGGQESGCTMEAGAGISGSEVVGRTARERERRRPAQIWGHSFGRRARKRTNPVTRRIR